MTRPSTPAVLPLCILGLGLGLGLGMSACAPEEPGAPQTNLLVPMAGRYQATLTGYTVRGCEDALGEPVGVLDASVRLGFLEQGKVELSGSRIWPYGNVLLSPGDPRDTVARLSWTGTADVQVALLGCALQVAYTAAYFPTTPERGSLHTEQRFSKTAGCALRLPCQNRAIWTLAHFD